MKRRPIKVGNHFCRSSWGKRRLLARQEAQERREERWEREKAVTSFPRLTQPNIVERTFPKSTVCAVN